ncbi:MAG: hypothetical protein AAF436_06425 [Myxococcota bacterium]
MPEADPAAKPYRVLAFALGVALLAVAFLLGRESTRFGQPQGSDDRPPTEAAGTVAPMAEPEVIDIGGPPNVAWPTETDEALEARIERRPDGTILLSNAGGSREAGAVAEETRAAQEPNSGNLSVSGYFDQMDSIRAGEEMGDPNAFAMGIVKSAFGGSTDGIAKLQEDAAALEQKMQAIKPPPACATYHAQSLEAVAEGKALLEDLEAGIANRDIQRLTAIAGKAKALQATTAELQAMERQLRPDG